MSTIVRRRLGLLLGLALIAALALFPGIAFKTAPPAHAAPTACGQAPPTNDGWKVVFKDDFKGTKGTLPDPKKWVLIEGTSYPGGPPQYGTWENQTNTNDPENVSLDGDGCLRITALRNRPVETMDLEDGKFPNTEIKGWTAARMETKRADFKAPEDGIMRVDYRIQLPNIPEASAKGYWPAFWMYPGSLRQDRMSWPNGCEYDLVENVQAKRDELWNVVHCKRDLSQGTGGNWGGSFNEPTGVANNGQARCQPTSCQEAMHSGYFESDRTGQTPELRWYMDGKLTYKVSPTPEQLSDWNTMYEHEGFNLVANIAMGGAFPASRGYGGGPFSTTQSGGQLILDYVQVSTKTGSGAEDPEPEPSPTTTAPQPTVEPSPTVETTTEPEPTQPPPPPTHDSGILEAEKADSSKGVEVKDSFVTAKNDSSLTFRNVKLDEADRLMVTYRQATTANGDGGFIRIKVCDQSRDFTVSSAGSTKWQSLPFDLAPITAICDVTVTFDSGQPRPYIDVDKLEISKSTFLNKAADFLDGLFGK